MVRALTAAVLLALGTARGGACSEISFLWREFPSHLARDAREAFWGRHLAALALAGAPTAAARAYDEEIHRSIQRRRFLGGADVAGELLGQSYSQYGFVGLVYAAGKASGNPELVVTSELMLESVSLAGVTSWLLKLATRRERPDGSDRLSFPSLHAAGSFAIAATLQLRHGWKAGAPAALGAAYVSLARMQRGKHFASDNVFGAAIGAAVSHATWKVHQGWEPRLTLLPVPGGAALSLRF